MWFPYLRVGLRLDEADLTGELVPSLPTEPGQPTRNLDTMDAEADNRDSELERLRKQVLSLQAKIARHQSGQVAAEQTHSAERLRVNSGVDTAEDGLREGNTSGDLILESATGYAILTTDLDGSVTAWNEGARRLLGWDEVEALGQDARMIFTPPDRPAGAPDHHLERRPARGRADAPPPA